jgi:hypothetical protein
MKEETERKLTPRDRVLVNAVKRAQEYDRVFGDPKIVSACTGELQRVLLKYASKSDRRIGPAEHAALDQALVHFARIACGPVVHSDSYVECGLYTAVAAEAALASVSEAEPINKHERRDYRAERQADEIASGLGREQLEDKSEAEKGRPQ